MKNILKITILFFFYTVSHAQITVNLDTFNSGSKNDKYFKDIDNNYQTYIGTWENVTGNTTFRVILWKETMAPLTTNTNSFIDKIYGRFLIIQNEGTLSETTCNSVKYYPQSNTTSEFVILGWTATNKGFAASFQDTCASGSILRAQLIFRIIDTTATPLQAHWTIKHGRLFDGEVFAVPLDCILTKVD